MEGYLPRFRFHGRLIRPKRTALCTGSTRSHLKGAVAEAQGRPFDCSRLDLKDNNDVDPIQPLAEADRPVSQQEARQRLVRSRRLQSSR
jgi:hypothetical protein